MEIELLQPGRLAFWCGQIAISPEAAAALQTMAVQVRANSDLHAIFAAFHEKTALRGEWLKDWGELPSDPAVQAALGARSSQFFLLAYLSALPYAWRRYQQLGISLEIFQATMLDFKWYIEDYRDLRGEWGYDQFAWIWRHLTCRLFRLGRLQYMLAPFSGGVTALRRRADGEVLLLANPKMPLRPDGCAWGAGENQREQTPSGGDSWFPGFDATPAGWRGHPVSPYGVVQSSPVFLSLSEWDAILQDGDTILDLHIPRKDPFHRETCSASYAQALEFFPRHFPDRLPKALFCHTWMFSPQLQQFLPPESNLVQFQREFYLYPSPGNVNFLWSFVFGEKYPERATAPRDTSLRRAVLDWLDGGGEIFDLPGLMFHRPEEWGTQPYMRAWDATAGSKFLSP